MSPQPYFFYYLSLSSGSITEVKRGESTEVGVLTWWGWGLLTLDWIWKALVFVGESSGKGQTLSLEDKPLPFLGLGLQGACSSLAQA